MAFPQTHVRPCLAGIGGLVEPVAPVGAPGAGGLAGADPDYVRVRGRDGDVTDRDDRLIVEDGHPRNAVVHRLPEASRPGRHVDGGRFELGNRDVDEPPALASRPDSAERERIEHFRPERLSREVGSQQQRRQRDHCHGADGFEDGTCLFHATAPCEGTWNPLLAWRPGGVWDRGRPESGDAAKRADTRSLTLEQYLPAVPGVKKEWTRGLKRP
jgi:hypothetical protein